MILGGSHGWKCDLKLLLCLLTLTCQQSQKFPSGMCGEGAIRGGHSAEQGGAKPCLGQQMSCLDEDSQDETPLLVVHLGLE